jgi:hypothetical protein
MYDEYEYDYPDQMKIILSSLQKRGELHVSGKTVERLYREFSDSRYAAGWMSIDTEDDELLASFAYWLADVQL